MRANNQFLTERGVRAGKRCHHFTILEVVLAVAILAFAFIAAMELAADSSRRSAKALEKWRRRHMLSQAVEYFLLTGPGHSIPEDIFHYEGYSAVCVEQSPDIPSDVDSESGPWRLVKLKISINDENGSETASIAVHKILRGSSISP